MDAIAHGLDRWLPRLLAVWRRMAPPTRRGPHDRLHPKEAEQIAVGVRRLSEGLTRDRCLAGKDYFTQPDLLGAYLLYFWPVSYIQAQHLLQDLPARPNEILDLGSGPGAFAAACYDLGAKTITLADRSQPALKIGAELFRLAGKTVRTQSWDPQASLRIPAGAYDLIGMSHVLNELWPDAPDRLERRLRLLEQAFLHLHPAGHLLLVEPALTPTSRALLTLRDRLLASGHRLLAPCLWTRACPALSKPEDTCHAEIAWSPPLLLQDLIQRAGLKKKSLKMTALLWSNEPKPLAPAMDSLFRIVSEPLLSKNGRIRLLGCGPAGRLSLAMKPSAATPANQIFLQVRRGDLIRVSNAMPREGGLTLTPESRVERVRRTCSA